MMQLAVEMEEALVRKSMELSRQRADAIVAAVAASNAEHNAIQQEELARIREIGTREGAAESTKKTLSWRDWAKEPRCVAGA